MVEKNSQKINLDLLIEAQALCRADPVRASARFGLASELVDDLAKAPASRLVEIAETGIVVFTPRNCVALHAALRGDRGWRAFLAQVAATDAAKAVV